VELLGGAKNFGPVACPKSLSFEEREGHSFFFWLIGRWAKTVLSSVRKMVGFLVFIPFIYLEIMPSLYSAVNMSLWELDNGKSRRLSVIFLAGVNNIIGWETFNFKNQKRETEVINCK
jgi:hypothetical protein